MVILNIKGFPEAIRGFDTANKKTIKAARKGLFDTAIVVRDTAKRLVPVDTGRLRDSIGIFVDTPDRLTVFADTPYAAVIEFGFQGSQIVRQHERTQSVVFGRPITPIRVTVRGHVRFVDRRPKPYLRPAGEIGGSKMQEIIGKRVNAVL